MIGSWILASGELSSMDRERAEDLRNDVDQLVQEQLPSRKAFAFCPHDGKPCFRPWKGCELSSDLFTEEEILLWRCPRFPNRRRFHDEKE